MKKAILLLMVFCSLLSTGKVKAQPTQPYVILTTISDTNDNWYQAVKVLRDYRNAQVIVFDPAHIDWLVPLLMNAAPRYVAVVLKPSQLDINFVREFLMISTNLDSDPFSDFSYGFITGATAQDALDFVNRIIQAETQGIQNYPLKVSGYAASSINQVYTTPGDYMKFLNPSTYSDIYLMTDDSASGKNFFLANTSYMLNNKVLDIGYNGDPHMLWLFEGGNTSPNPPVWFYDSTLIEDPSHARVGLTSYDIGSLDLFPAVAFNGACHSGEPRRVMVEGDIAATFGDTQGLIKFYTMSDSFSYALSILKTGITGYFAPCGANNANDQAEEVYNTFLFHEPLGDIHKRSNDAVVMGFLGNRPNLKLYVDGGSAWGTDILASGTFDPNDWSGASSMLGGKANRIYFGDPLYNPFKNNHSDSLNITKTAIDSINPTTLDINLNYNKPDVSDAYFPVWDKFHFSDTRIYAPVEMPAWVGDVTSFAVVDSSGPYHIVIHAVEHFFGKTILHIEVDIPNDMYAAINYHIKFRIHVVSTGIATPATDSQIPEVFPNPSNSLTTIKFSNPKNELHSLVLIDAKGQLVRRIEGIRSNSISFDHQGMEAGMYFYQLRNKTVVVGQGKVIVQD